MALYRSAILFCDDESENLVARKKGSLEISHFAFLSLAKSMSPQTSIAASIASSGSSEGKEKKSTFLSRARNSVLSSLSNNSTATTTEQAARRFKEEKSGKGTDLETSEVNKFVPAAMERVFLGAVKDDWPLYSLAASQPHSCRIELMTSILDAVKSTTRLESR